MSENVKTITFVLAAVLAIGLAVGLNRQPPADLPHEDVNTPLFPEFKDPLDAKSLEIVRFDDTSGEIDRFRVAQVDGVWTIPSHGGYPADAEQQLAAAATSIVGLKVLGVETDEASLHEEYGVVEPNEESPGQEGVGTLVVMRGSDNDLARLIIGKEVKQAEGLRYVRRPGQNRVYRVAVDPKPLSTNFSDWIEADLLQMSGAQMKRIELKDYGVELVDSGGVIKWDSNVILAAGESGRWELVRLVDYDEEGKPVETELGPDEQIDTEKINQLRFALDDLKIVNVRRKPAGITPDLAVDQQLLTNINALRSLASHGFSPARLPDGNIEIMSNNGEVVVGASDGVEYTLRFGDVASISEAAASDETKKDDSAKQDGEEDEGTSINRYLLVTARFNPELIPEPKLQELPQAEKPASDGAAAGTAAETDKAEETDDAEEGDGGKQGDAAETASEEGTTQEGDDAASAKPSGEGTNPASEEAPKSQSVREAEAERKRIEAANKQAQKDYEQKVEAGKKRAAAINSRFAQWYYVIPDSTYKRIHLERGDVITKKGAAEASKPAGIPGFQGNPLEGLNLPGGN